MLKVSGRDCLIFSILSLTVWRLGRLRSIPVTIQSFRCNSENSHPSLWHVVTAMVGAIGHHRTREDEGLSFSSSVGIALGFWAEFGGDQPLVDPKQLFLSLFIVWNGYSPACVQFHSNNNKTEAACVEALGKACHSREAGGGRQWPLLLHNYSLWRQCGQ